PRLTVARQLLIDHDNGGIRRGVMIVEAAPVEDADVHQLEVARTHDVHPDREPVGGGDSLILDRDLALRAGEAERNRLSQRGGAHAGKPTDTIEQLAIEG